jgi:sporulation integral membrane protein YtvI
MRLSENSDQIGESVGAFFDKISSLADRKSPILESLLKIDQFREFWENIDSVIANVITSTVSSITSWIPGALLGIIGKLPSLMIFLLITVISCFYFSSDIDRINQKTVSLLPMKMQKKVPDIKKRLFKRISGYVRAYFILLLLTFGELLVGFSVLRVPYPLILAVVISILDILPLLGVGTVLIPWSIISFAIGDHKLGIGLLVLFAVNSIVRELLEPKIVGKSLNIHPLLMLALIYVGYALFGIQGLFMIPVIAVLLGFFIKKKDSAEIDETSVKQ